MLNLQRLLQKKKNQNTAENTSRPVRTRAGKTALLSMAAVGVISFLAPPVGTDRSVFALAAAAGSADELSAEQAEHHALVAAVIRENEEADMENSSAAAEPADKARRLDLYREAAEKVKQAWITAAQTVYENVAAQTQDELQLLELSAQDGLSEDDVLVKTAPGGDAAGEDGDGASGSAASGENAAGQESSGNKELPTADELLGADEFSQAGEAEEERELPSAEETFFSGTDYSNIPAELSISYNADYAALNLSSEQLAVLERIVEAEAGDEDAYGKILVANVVLNRVLDDEFPDTVKEVVFQNNGKTYQFSPVRSGGRYYTVKVSEHTKEAVARALAGEDYSDGALYFFARRYTSAKKAKWFDTSLRKIVEYGCHEFFGNK